MHACWAPCCPLHELLVQLFRNSLYTEDAVYKADGWAVMEADFSGTSADGASFSIPFVAVFELDRDKIRREADYFDLYDFMRQLGTLPGAEATPAA